MFRRSGHRFADKNMRQTINARACSDSKGTEHALAADDQPTAKICGIGGSGCGLSPWVSSALAVWTRLDSREPYPSALHQ
jgi:hypothetical protein